jgi:Asp-tRNA(Asn)/Glu-tRNA(Gln) amidotransferase A subunit family amidase
MSWSMDKIGPICRTGEYSARVLEVIRGRDGIDETVIDTPFNYDATQDLSGLRIGYRPGVSSTVRNRLAAIVGQSQIVSLDLPDYPHVAMSLILDAEAAAVFDEFTRSGEDTLLTGQGKWDWPNLLRTARTIPAVEYLQADRLRRKLIQEMAVVMNTVDVWVANNLEEATLFISNLTGQPCVIIPHGNGSSLSFIGRLYDEATILTLAKVYQDATSYHISKPPLFINEGRR